MMLPAPREAFESTVVEASETRVVLHHQIAELTPESVALALIVIFPLAGIGFPLFRMWMVSTAVWGLPELIVVVSGIALSGGLLWERSVRIFAQQADLNFEQQQAVSGFIELVRRRRVDRIEVKDFALRRVAFRRGKMTDPAASDGRRGEVIHCVLLGEREMLWGARWIGPSAPDIPERVVVLAASFDPDELEPQAVAQRYGLPNSMWDEVEEEHAA